MIYIKENIITYNNKKYERLFNHSCFITGKELIFREIFNEDDYDYVEDEELIKELHNVFTN